MPDWFQLAGRLTAARRKLFPERVKLLSILAVPVRCDIVTVKNRLHPRLRVKIVFAVLLPALGILPPRLSYRHRAVHLQSH